MQIMDLMVNCFMSSPPEQPHQLIWEGQGLRQVSPVADHNIPVMCISNGDVRGL